MLLLAQVTEADAMIVAAQAEEAGHAARAKIGARARNLCIYVFSFRNKQAITAPVLTTIYQALPGYAKTAIVNLDNAPNITHTQWHKEYR